MSTSIAARSQYTVSNRLTDFVKKDLNRSEPASLFLTGGTGFFGRSLLRYIDQLNTEGLRPYHVTVMTRSVANFLAEYPEFSELPWLSFYEGDILSKSRGFPQSDSFSHVLHAAADSAPSAKMRPLDRYDQIVGGTRNALEFAVRAGAKRFLLTSSGGVYGAQPTYLDAIPESYNGMPDPMMVGSTYGIAKRQAEHLCSLFSDRYGLDVVIARCFAFVGPDLPLDEHFAIGNFMRDALRGNDIVINGDGTPVRSYLYQDDLADWLLTLLEKGRASEAYNVGSDVTLTIVEIANLVARLLGTATEVRLMCNTSADDIIRKRYVPSIEKVKSEFGLRVATCIEEAILRTAQKLRRSHS